MFASAPLPAEAIGAVPLADGVALVTVVPVAAAAPLAAVVVVGVPPDEPALLVVGGVVAPEDPMVVVAMGWDLYAGWLVQTAGVARQPDTAVAG